MLCHKCKTNPPFEDDSWCLSCSGWESIGIDLTARWDIPGLRELACEAVISTARHLKALRRLSSGLAAQQASSGGSSGARSKRNAAEELVKPEDKKQDLGRREPLPRSRSAPTPAGGVKEEKAPTSPGDPSGEEDDDEEDEESEEVEGTRRLPFPLSGSTEAARPSEPAGPPPSHRRGDKDRDRREHREHRERDCRERGDQSKRKRRRAGRKHKNLSRLVENPNARVHRALDASYWSRESREEKGFARHR